MPIYEYVTENNDADCPHCGPGFDELQKLSEDPLTQCPQCAGPIRRRVSAPQVQSGDSHRMDPKHFSKHGFTQYKRAGNGVYEKTGGKGPRYISDD